MRLFVVLPFLIITILTFASTTKLKTITNCDVHYYGHWRKALHLNCNSDDGEPIDYFDGSEEDYITCEGESYKKRIFQHLIISRECQLDDLPMTSLEVYPNMYTLDLSGIGLKTISRNLSGSENMNEITLRHNQLTELPLQRLRGNRNLIVVDLSFNLISEIKESDFEGWGSLQYLGLHGNRLTRLAANIFSHSTNDFFDVKLTRNRISSIDRLAFKGLDNLKKLNFDGNELTTLESEMLKNVPRLNHLVLCHNRIQHFDFDILPENTLKNLDLMYNNLTSVNNTKVFGKIEELSIGGKHLNLDFITKASFPQLATLRIENNNAVCLDLETFLKKDVLSSLEHLKLELNCITELKKSYFENVKEIKILDLSHNKLTHLDEDVFESIEPFEMRSGLRALHLSHNEISQFKPNIIRKMYLLETLDLSVNKLTSLDADLFQGLDWLMYFNVSHNHLTHFQFDMLPQIITWVDLSYNKLASANSSKYLKLAQILLTGNQLTNLDFLNPHTFTQLHRLDVGGNHFECSKVQPFSNNSIWYRFDIRIPLDDTDNGEKESVRTIPCDRNIETILVTTPTGPEDVPLNLRAHDVTTHSMTLSWSPPIRLNPKEYKISYDAIKEFVDSQGFIQTQIVQRKKIILKHEIRTHTINGLSPFTTYNVNVSAVPSDESYRPPTYITVTTEMAAPQPMVKPEFYGVVNGEKIQVILPQASEEYGPISHYYLIVVPENKSDSDRLPDQYLTEDVFASKFNKNKDEPSNEPYIAAKFPQRNIPYTFHLGGGEAYHNFINRKLERGKRYRIFVRAIVDTPQKDLYTSSPFSEFLALD